jgi:transposase-like protein
MASKITMALSNLKVLVCPFCRHKWEFYSFNNNGNILSARRWKCGKCGLVANILQDI